jgi:ornithine carbamoyltransferase
MLNAARLGMDFVLATPGGYEANAGVIAKAEQLAGESNGKIQITHDPSEAVSGANAVYTDVWASMGQEDEADARRRIFAPYQVNGELMAQAAQGALFMHCLPAKRGQETTDAVLESSASVVFDEAENRLHAQKALLLMMLG